MNFWPNNIPLKYVKYDIFSNYKNPIIVKLISGKKILDVGCGVGNLSFLLSKMGYEVVAIDVSSTYIKFLRKRNVKNNIKVVKDDISKTKLKQKFDCIICSEVLEHIEDDSIALKKIRSILRKNGTLIITVPAHSWLFGRHDRYLKHFRRYDKKMIVEKLKENNFKIEKIRYWNLIGLFSTIYYSKIMDKEIPYIKLLEKMSKNKLLKETVNLMEFLDQKISKFYGLTIIIKCKKLV